MIVRVYVNQAALEQLLKTSRAEAAVRAVGQQIADNVTAQHLVAESGWAAAGEGPEIDAVVSDSTTPGAVVVTVDHPAGLAMEAKHGVLTKAAAQAGFEIRQR